LDLPYASVGQRLDHADLVGSRHKCLFDLEAVAGAGIEDVDELRHVGHGSSFQSCGAARLCRRRLSSNTMAAKTIAIVTACRPMESGLATRIDQSPPLACMARRRFCSIGLPSSIPSTRGMIGKPILRIPKPRMPKPVMSSRSNALLLIE